jgi:hypothetical protein
MKFCANVSLFLVLMTAATAQELPRDYLIRLNDSDFPASLRAKGILPLHHAASIWAVRTSNQEALRETAEAVTTAINITIELQPGAKDVARAITNDGGIVTRRYQTLSEMSAIVPTSKLADIQKLPGVKRVRKSRSYPALNGTHE